jgi:hypothetical protein
MQCFLKAPVASFFLVANVQDMKDHTAQKMVSQDLLLVLFEIEILGGKIVFI